jgi:Transposase and inactivated derivatives
MSFKGIYLVCGYTDMRYGIDTLASIIEKRYKLFLFVPNILFLFCGRRANKIKGLLWEGDGFLLLYKRLEDGRFIWPRTPQEVLDISQEQFDRLMQGFQIESTIRKVKPKELC